ncbi:hypothetical protein ACXWTF_12645 [Thiomicrolovo sp. ZZH C-3]
MKILKATKGEIEITKPLLDLARSYDVELHYDQIDRMLRIHTMNDDNAFLEYKVEFNSIYMKDFVATFDYNYSMESVENIPQEIRTKGGYTALFAGIQKVFEGGVAGE